MGSSEEGFNADRSTGTELIEHLIREMEKSGVEYIAFPVPFEDGDRLFFCTLIDPEEVQHLLGKDKVSIH